MTGSAAAVAVLGAGAGGAAAAADLALRGHEVRLWHPRPERLEQFAQGVAYRGALGEGVAAVEPVAELAAALDGADAAVACLPAVVRPRLLAALAAVRPATPLVLNPGGVGGALHLRAALPAPPPSATLSTLTYVARLAEPGVVHVTGVARRVRGAALPGGGRALELARELFPQVEPAPDVLAADLANVNLVLHPPGAVLGAAWVEATGGDFRFYVEGMTPGVVRVLESLDAERLAVARAYGHELEPLADEMRAIGTAGDGETGDAIRGGGANAAIRAPDSLAHRYYREDVAYGLAPFCALAAAAGVEVPVAGSLLRLGLALTGDSDVVGAAELGIAGLDAAGVLRLVR
ncbi:MAG TPA: NAD/NADP octopine/nopaline dehydrogenase family protein [Gaiellaceae bacterium]|nr:NAD/NADP octopine/nopaline dehydrogenase family protein [Gaiellaceae bacterium]